MDTLSINGHDNRAMYKAFHLVKKKWSLAHGGSGFSRESYSKIFSSFFIFHDINDNATEAFLIWHDKFYYLTVLLPSMSSKFAYVLSISVFWLPLSTR